MSEIIKNNQNQKFNNNGLKFNVKCTFVILLLLLLIFLEAKSNGSYLDEVIGLLSAIYVIFLRNKVERRDLITIVILFVVVVIGIISNLLFNLNNSFFSIAVDIIAETKLLFSFFFIKYFLSTDEKKQIINLLIPMAKLYTVLSFVCSILSQFVNLGMTGEIRYGIKSFQFFFNMNFQYVAVFMLVFGILVCNTKMSEKKKIYYYFMALISLILSTKAPPIMFSIIFVSLSFYFKRHKKLNFAVIALGVGVLIYAGQYQINEYLFTDTDSPRKLFFQYAFKTANTYFPLGSGFGTFGSDQAVRIYSPLYYQYGFDKLNGMSPDNPAFLSDTFWPMAIGQFGWFGAILYLLVYILMFLSLVNKDFGYQTRAFLFAAFLQYMIHGVGSAILSNSAGMIGFMALAIFSVVNEDEKNKKSRIHLRL